MNIKLFAVIGLSYAPKREECRVRNIDRGRDAGTDGTFKWSLEAIGRNFASAKTDLKEKLT